MRKKLGFAFIMFNSVVALAQDTTTNKINVNRFTLGYGIGIDNHPDNKRDDLALLFEYALQSYKNIFGIAYRSSNEIGIILTPKPNENINSFELSYGRVLTKGNYFLDVTAGISYTHRLDRGKFLYQESIFGPAHYERVESNSFGLPLSMRSLWTLGKKCGIGIEVYANVSKTSNYSISLIGQLGNLRK